MSEGNTCPASETDDGVDDMLGTTLGIRASLAGKDSKGSPVVAAAARVHAFAGSTGAGASPEVGPSAVIDDS